MAHLWHKSIERAAHGVEVVGEYLGEGKRKGLVVGDVLDVPLLRPDGTLHIVELKGAKIPKLVEQYRGTSDRSVGATGDEEAVPLVLGPDATRAVGQVMSYLTHLDEQRDTILSRFKIDVRRASATVVIGHPNFTPYSRAEVDETLRVFNSHHTRTQVRHYSELIEAASRALDFGGLTSVDEGSDVRKARGPAH